ncbi:MAG: MFS transporter [Aestuariivirgaceae bacterium]
MHRNITLYPWFQACRNLLFWQAVWFLYFQNELSAAEAILLAAIYDIATSALEVPSGYLSDRIGRRITLIIAMLANVAGCLLIGLGGSFLIFALAQIMLGIGTAFTSGTDHALLYDSLLEERQEGQVAWHEARAWRYTFAGLAVSALAGGLMSLHSIEIAFLASALSAAIAFFLAVMFREPSHVAGRTDALPPLQQAGAVFERLKDRALAWLFALAVGKYVFSHVPFVFGQPFINEALGKIGFAAETPAVSGTVVAAMMLISVIAGWFALPLTRVLGTAGIFLLALAMQVGLIAILAVTVHPAAIALLLLRMVPEALTWPMILATVQPKLQSSYRATYLSLQSLIGRVILAASLITVSLTVPETGILQHAILQTILVWYVAAGLILLAGLAATTRFLRQA